MAYVSLYRKYRPQSFAEVVGQRHVTETLANAITEDRLHHAYLFTGPRGTGKTSTARILAKAINCDEGPTAEPCQVCEPCTSIAGGSAVDVVELDMASHGGVDDARELRERVLFAPARLRRKVYILDEVHMASTAAFNALLKLIEEPPGHVLFAMATTDPQKVLPTIMSRVQRLDLRRVTGTDVADHLRRICALEEVEVEDAAVDAIVRAGDGSVRDTLSILDQVLAFAGTEITVDDVAELLGHTPAERVFDAVTLLAEGDLGGLLSHVDAMLSDGIDPRRFTLDLVAHLRDLLVIQTVPDRPDLVDASADHRTRLAGQAPLLDRDDLVAAIDLLGGTVAEMRRGPARLPLELALSKLALARAVDGVSAPARPAAPSVERSEPEPQPPPQPETEEEPEPEPPSQPEAAGEPEPAEEPEAAGEPEPAEEPEAVEEPDPDEEPQPAEEPEPDTAPGTASPEPAASTPPDRSPARTAGDVDLTAIRDAWAQVLDVVKTRSPRVHAIAGPGTPVALDGRALILGYPPRYAQFHAEQVERDENAGAVAAAVRQVLGTEVTIRSTVIEDDDGEAGTSGSSGPEAAREQDLAEDEVAVREAEVDPPTIDDPDAATERAAELLRDELGARAVDEGSDR